MKPAALPGSKRIAAAIAGLALLAVLIGGLQRAGEQAADVPEEQSAAEPDPLSAELRRCSRLTRDEAMDDERCQRAWVLNRQRFFGPYFDETEKD